jgi:hypothetical protein
MSAVEPSPTSRRDPSAAIALRLGAVLAVALAFSVAVNVFAGSVAFATLLTALAAFTAWGEQASDAVTRLRARHAAGEDQEPVDAPELELATPLPAPSTPAGASARR